MGLDSRSRAITSAASAALLWLAAAGCGGSDSLPRQEVAGEVTIDGTPLKTGLITFLPASPDVPTQGGSAIVEGKYSLSRAQGLVPGQYKVVISSPEDKPEEFTDKSTNNNAPGMPPIPAKEVIPAQYNNKSLLTAEVVAGRKNIFAFDLTAKAPTVK